MTDSQITLACSTPWAVVWLTFHAGFHAACHVPRGYMKGIVLVLLVVLSGTPTAIPAQNLQEVPKDTSVPQKEWPAYGGGPLNNHYSGLAQINRANVKRL